MWELSKHKYNGRYLNLDGFENKCLMRFINVKWTDGAENETSREIRQRLLRAGVENRKLQSVGYGWGWGTWDCQDKSWDKGGYGWSSGCKEEQRSAWSIMGRKTPACKSWNQREGLGAGRGRGNLLRARAQLSFPTDQIGDPRAGPRPGTSRFCHQLGEIHMALTGYSCLIHNCCCAVRLCMAMLCGHLEGKDTLAGLCLHLGPRAIQVYHRPQGRVVPEVGE